MSSSQARQRKTSSTKTEDNSKKIQLKNNRNGPSIISSLLKYFVYSIIGLVIVLVSLHQIKSYLFWSEAKAPGELIPISHYGQKIHLYCEGNVKDSEYLVLLDHGAAGFYLEWNSVQSELTRRGIPSCSYDRLGYGYSSDLVMSDTRTTTSTSSQLHEVLENAQLSNKKLVFVGFSWGGINGITYSKLYPNSVKGLVLVDPGLSEWFDLSWSKDTLPTNPVTQTVFRVMNYLGIFTYMIPHLNFMKNFPKEHLEHYINLYSYGKTIDTLIKEMVEGPSYNKDLSKANIKHNDVPLILLNAQQHSMMNYSPTQLKEKNQVIKKFATQYSNSKVIDVDTDHQIHMEKPDIVVDQIVEMLKIASH